MNNPPCDREAVALLASASLDAASTDRTRGHLQQCPACREYFRELSEVCTGHSRAAQRLPAAEVSARLRGRILMSIKPRPRRGWWDFEAALGMRFGGLAGAALLALLLAAGLMSRHPPAGTSPLAAHSESPSPTSEVPPEGTQPKLMAYRLALNRSTDEFDRLLAREAARAAVRPTPALRPGMAWVDSEL